MSHRHKRGIARTQTALLPPAVEDYVGAHALVRVIDCYVDGLDMAALGFRQSVPLGEGRPPYAPDDLLKLYLYGYWNRVRTSRRLAAALEQLRRRDERLRQAQTHLAAHAEAGTGQDQERTPRVGLTDPDGVRPRASGTPGMAGYNVQQAVDAEHKLILAHAVTTERNDHASLEPMASQARQALGAASMTVLADTAYMNGAQAAACEARGITPVVPMREAVNPRARDLYPKSQFIDDPATNPYRCPAGAWLERYKRDRHWHADAAERAPERTQRNPRFMRLRSAVAEPPFGNLKAMMPGGFLPRTLPKVKGEMAIAVLTYNLKRTLNILGFEQLMQKPQMMIAPRWA